MWYFVKKPNWVRKFYGDCIWEINTTEKVLYLTFDDGPDPSQTPFVLNELEKHGAKATFFCLGKHVLAHPETYSQIIYAGHSVGNHTHSHLDGWRTSSKKYFQDISFASQSIKTSLFRPPFGHITWWQVDQLKKKEPAVKIILWDVLSADFDTNTSADQCFRNVTDNAKPGSIILFHDNEIAAKNLRQCLPQVLRYFKEEGYRFESLNQ